MSRLINLKKIRYIREGNKESLLLVELGELGFDVCKKNLYEEIRLGFELLFE